LAVVGEDNRAVDPLVVNDLASGGIELAHVHLRFERVAGTLRVTGVALSVAAAADATVVRAFLGPLAERERDVAFVVDRVTELLIGRARMVHLVADAGDTEVRIGWEQTLAHLRLLEMLE
jgi:hypothetical protein